MKRLVFEGYHIFYPYRRQDSPAFMAFLQVLRDRNNNRIKYITIILKLTS